MKRYIKNSDYILAAKEQSTGPFWYIPDTEELIAFPYNPDEFQNAISNNGLTYTHKRLWTEIAGQYKKQPYNYYPRGRVEIDNQGRSVIYMNLNVPESIISEIKTEFGIRGEVIIKIDGSSHYLCYLDEGWKADT